MSYLIEKFEEAGYNKNILYNYDYSLKTHQSVALSGIEFYSYIKKNFGNQQIDIVSHSMGGLVGRYAAKVFLSKQIVHFVSLGSPNHGAINAGWCLWFPFIPACTPAVFDMINNSGFLSYLNSLSEIPSPTRYLTYRTPCDTYVAENSVPLTGARNERIDLCNAHNSLKQKTLSFDNFPFDFSPGVVEKFLEPILNFFTMRQSLKTF